MQHVKINSDYRRPNSDTVMPQFFVNLLFLVGTPPKEIVNSMSVNTCHIRLIDILAQIRRFMEVILGDLAKPPHWKVYDKWSNLRVGL